jgi:plasmid maintenance system antidote protein VapI
MKKQIFTTEELRDRLLSFGLSRSYAFLLSTGRRTPSMQLAGRLMNTYGLKPEFWIELNRKYKATR